MSQIGSSDFSSACQCPREYFYHSLILQTVLPNILGIYFNILIENSQILQLPMNRRILNPPSLKNLEIFKESKIKIALDGISNIRLLGFDMKYFWLTFVCIRKWMNGISISNVRISTLYSDILIFLFFLGIVLFVTEL